MNDVGKPDSEGSHAGGEAAAATIPKGAGKASPEQKKPTAAAGAGGDGKPAASQKSGDAEPDQPAPASPKTQLEAIPLAIDAGWTMAVLFGELQRPTLTTQGLPDRLPTENELSPEQRMDIEEARLNALLTRLKTLLGSSAGAAIEFPTVDLENDTKSSGKSGQVLLGMADLAILTSLACAGREYGVAYQLGRSLRDTANPPPRPDATADLYQPEIAAREAAIKASAQWQADPEKNKLTPEQQDTQAGNQAKAEAAARDALRHQLARSRVSTLQEWLSTLAPYLTANSAAIVSVSIGRWCDLVLDDLRPEHPGRRTEVPGPVQAGNRARSGQEPAPAGRCVDQPAGRRRVLPRAADTGGTGRGGRGRSQPDREDRQENRRALLVRA